VTRTEVNIRRDKAGCVTVEVCGNVEVTAAPVLRRALVRAVLRSRPTRVVVDLHRAGRIDSVGIGTLVAADQIAADRHVPMFVRHPTPPVAAQLRAAGLPAAHVHARNRWPNRHFTYWLV
jgi:anti-anti-sigma factor